jgi:uncharacterized lipoprotein YmbA
VKTIMSHKTVQLIVGRLLTDEEWRLRFVREPLEALVALRDRGLELTETEIDALVRTDRSLWPEAAARIDPQLQRCTLRDT